MTKITPGRNTYCVVAVALAMLFGARNSAADTLTLSWDLNTEPEVKGYRVYVGTQSGNYTQAIDVRNSNVYVFSSAVPGQRYCFAVLAYSGSDVSPFSEEVCGRSNDFPTLASPGNQTGRVGLAVSLQLSASDPDGTPIGFQASGLPAGLTLSPILGTISGTPTTPGTYSVVAQASDGVLAAQRSFAWTIAAPIQNRQPTLVDPVTQSSALGSQVQTRSPGAAQASVNRSYTGTVVTTRPSTTAASTTATTTIGHSTRGASINEAQGPGKGERPAPAKAVYTGRSANSRQQAPDTTAHSSTSLPVTRSMAHVPEPDTVAVVNDGRTELTDTLAMAPLVVPAETTPRIAVSSPGAAPRVTIETPVNLARFAVGSEVIFLAAARDAWDSDLTSLVVWTSSRDGRLGTGGLQHTQLTAGTHIITATVTDARGVSRSSRVTIVVVP